MQFCLSRLLVAGVCVAGLTAAAEAATYYVAPGGSDANAGSSAAPFATIQKAADVAVAGDTIVVRAGTFAGAKFSRSGAFDAPITLRGEAGAVVASPGPLNSNGDNLWIRNASYVTVEALEVRSAPRAGIAVQAEPTAESHGVVLRGCNAHDNSRWGIFTAYAEGILIENNTTSYSAIEHGVYVSNSSDNPVIRNNVSHHNNASGIQINADPALPGDGICSNATIQNNVIYENGVAGGAAINLASVINSRVIGNLLYDNHASGIAGWDDGFSPSFGTHDNLFLNNTIVQAANGRWCVSLSNGSHHNTFLNNVLVHLGTRGAIEADASSESGLTSNFNAVTDRFSDGSVFYTLAQWRARGAGHDQSSFVATAAQLFADQPNDDYHLRAGSPAIDAGTARPEVTVDLDGNARPQGASLDIGAYETGGAPAAATSTALTASPSSSVYGQAVTLSATVTSSAGVPTGSVQFLDGSAVLATATLAGGSASASVSSLVVGAHALTARYAGATGFAASVSPAAAVSVARAATTTALASSANPAQRRTNVTFTATVSVSAPGGGLPAGNVTFYENGVSIGRVALVNGRAQLTKKYKTAGTRRIQATYEGSASHATSQSAALDQVVQ